MIGGVAERAKTFKETWDNLEGYSERDLVNKKFEALVQEIRYLESVVEVLATNQIVNRQEGAQQPRQRKKKDESKDLSV